MLYSKFTAKIMLLTIVPLVIFFITVLSIQVVGMDHLSNKASSITKTGLGDIYEYIVQKRSRDITDKLTLRVERVLNDLNVIRAITQQVIDKPGKIDFDANKLNNSLEYNEEKKRSSFGKGDSNVSLNVWASQHDQDGKIDQPTLEYISSLTPLIKLLNTVNSFGSDKGWLYIIGPKTSPVLIMTPWSEVANSMDLLYPGHSESNWWDFFFPGLVEKWDKWITDPAVDIDKFSEQVTVTHLSKNDNNKRDIVSFFAPLWDKERTKNQGAAAIDFDITHFIELVNDEIIGKTGFSFLVQSDGSILGMQERWASVLGLEKQQAQADKYTNLTESKIADLRAIAKQGFSSDFYSHTITDNQGKEFLLSFRSVYNFNRWNPDLLEVNEENLYLGMIVPKYEILQVHFQIEDEIAAVSKNTRISIIYISIVLGALVIFFVALYAIRETKQIRIMNTGLASIKHKDFDTSIEVVSKDDLGDLAQTFNSMAYEIQASYSQLQFQKAMLEKTVTERTLHLQHANAELERLTQIDTLTNVYNRRYLDSQLQLKWREHIRNQQPLSLIMIDIDYFKNFNDHYGHQAGDDCLHQVANALAGALRRPTDILTRYGGEEFCALLSCGKEDAMLMANHLLKEVAALKITHITSEKGIVSISLGVNSVIPSNEMKLSEFIYDADQALYASKHKGRDQASLYVTIENQ